LWALSAAAAPSVAVDAGCSGIGSAAGVSSIIRVSPSSSLVRVKPGIAGKLLDDIEVGWGISVADVLAATSETFVGAVDDIGGGEKGV